VSAPTPTPLLAALALPFDAVELEAAARAAIDLNLDFDAVFRFNSDLLDLLARLGASLDLDLDIDVDIDGEEIAAAFADLINGIAYDINGAILAANRAVDLGAALVVEIATAAAVAGADGVDAVAGALVSLLAALTPEGGVAADLSAAVGVAIGDIADLIGTGILGAGAAVAWKATLDDLLVDLLATGGIALTNGVAGSLIGLLGGTADLPDIDGEDVVLAVGNLVEHFTDGISGALLTTAGAVELGVSVIGDLAQALADAGADISAGLSGGLDLSLPNLPNIDLAASVRALINQFAVALGIEIDVDVDVDGDVEGEGDEGVQRLASFTADVTDAEEDPTPVDDGIEPSDGEELPPADDTTDGADDEHLGDENLGEEDLGEENLGDEDLGDEDLGDEDLGNEDLDEAGELPDGDDTEDVADDTADESADESDGGDEDAGDGADGGTGGDTGDTGGDPSTD
jgi:hypothetical protein